MRPSGKIWRVIIALIAVVPAAQADDAKQVFDSIYGPRLKQVAATPDKADDVTLAKEMLAAARDNTNTPDLLAVLCDASYDLGNRHGDGYATAAEAMKLLADTVTVKRAAAREKLIAVLTKQSRTGKVEERDKVDEILIALLTTMGDEHMEKKRYAEAAADYSRALAIGKQKKSPALDAAKARMEWALSRDRTTKQLARLQEKLLANASDSATAEEIVKLYVFEDDDPAAAVAFLNRVKDEKLKLLVPLAAGAVKDVSEDNALKLGEWYRSESLTAQGPAKAGMLGRSIAYFEHYISQHTTADLNLAKATLVVKEMKAELVKTGQISPSNPSGGDKAVILDLGSGVKMKFVRIKAGDFPKGSDTELKVDRIAKGFYMGETEVTQAQWKAVMATTPWKGQRFVKEGDACPATYVNWNDAQEFLEKLAKTSKRKVRLPTEAEWEYACRAGTKTAYSFGDSNRELGDYAWFGGQQRNGNTNNEFYAHEVKTKKPNSWGLYDMHGNAVEWCEEKHDGVSRVHRGGSWWDDPDRCRAGHRSKDLRPDARGGSGGFRVVLDFFE